MNLTLRNADIECLRALIAHGGGRPEAIHWSQLSTLLDRVGGDIDLAATAVLMQPRPDWVREIVHGGGLPISATNIRS